MLIPDIIIPSNSTEGLSDGLVQSITRLSIPGEVYLNISENELLVDAFNTFSSVLLNSPCIVGPFNANHGEQAANWLNNGAFRVVIDCKDDDSALDTASTLPRDRTLVRLSGEILNDKFQFSAMMAQCALSCGGVILAFDAEDGTDSETIAEKAKEVVGWAQEVKRGNFFVAVSPPEPLKGSVAEGLVGFFHALGKDYPVGVILPCPVPCKPEDGAVPVDDDQLSLGRALCKCLRTDRDDGLYTTVVVDEFNVALGLVYSSDESICASLDTGRGVYWSRSRKSLWKKGDTSGAWQELLSIRIDCDTDALKFSVIQHGMPPAFCHKNTLTCWGVENGIPHLFRTLESRKVNPPPGSYTQRLFNDRELLRNKILEEGQELIEAVEEGDKVHVAEETADVIYFAMVACCAGNASLKDVAAQLDLRSRKVKRRPGNAKAERIAAANSILSGKDNAAA